ncbi:MAG: hypothetical protein Tsb0020_21520 [Haliangiales bacterium]
MTDLSPKAPALTVADLVAPLTTEAFLRERWLPETAFVSQPNPALVEQLTAHPALASAEDLVDALAARAKVPNHITVFGPESFRSQVPAEHAMDFCRAGYTLYMVDVERVVPAAAAQFEGVCAELGFLPKVYLEAFAAHAGSVSSWHYDHDINFQILLSGAKEWLIAPNQHIKNPLYAFHPSPNRYGYLDGFTEELYARDPDVPHTPPAAPRSGGDGAMRIRATAGSVVFLPRGFWHQVEATSDCFGVNLVLKGKTWASAIASALQFRLESSEAMRAYVAGLATASTHPAIVDTLEPQFAALKQQALAELADLTLDEVPLSGANLQLEWAPEAATRELVERGGEWLLELPDLFDQPVDIDPELAPFVAKLVALKRPFRWSQLLAIRGDLEPTNIRALIEVMHENQILVDPSAGAAKSDR